MTRFQPGQSGNPAGRPRGIQDRRTEYRRLLASSIPEVIESVVNAAREGDLAACKIILDKVIPPLKPVDTVASIPNEVSNGIAGAGRSVTRAMLNGAITPEQSGKMLEALGKASALEELNALEQRIIRLEENT